MTGWIYLRRFLVLQALLLWQGGFLFYAAVVVPIGSELNGRFQQGLVTDRVAFYLNIIGLISLILFAWELFTPNKLTPPTSRKGIWWIWCVTQTFLLGLHPYLHKMISVDTKAEDFQVSKEFYFWHEVYLWIWTLQWFLGVCYLLLILRDWTRNSRAPAGV